MRLIQRTMIPPFRSELRMPLTHSFVRSKKPTYSLGHWCLVILAAVGFNLVFLKGLHWSIQHKPLPEVSTLTVDFLQEPPAEKTVLAPENKPPQPSKEAEPPLPVADNQISPPPSEKVEQPKPVLAPQLEVQEPPQDTPASVETLPPQRPTNLNELIQENESETLSKELLAESLRETQKSNEAIPSDRPDSNTIGSLNKPVQQGDQQETENNPNTPKVEESSPEKLDQTVSQEIEESPAEGEVVLANNATPPGDLSQTIQVTREVTRDVTKAVSTQAETNEQHNTAPEHQPIALPIQQTQVPPAEQVTQAKQPATEESQPDLSQLASDKPEDLPKEGDITPLESVQVSEPPSEKSTQNQQLSEELPEAGVHQESIASLQTGSSSSEPAFQETLPENYFLSSDMKQSIAETKARHARTGTRRPNSQRGAPQPDQTGQSWSGVGLDRYQLGNYDWQHEAYMGRFAKLWLTNLTNRPPMDYVSGAHVQGGEIVLQFKINREGYVVEYEVTHVARASREMVTRLLDALVGVVLELPEDYDQANLEVKRLLFTYPPLRVRYR